MSSSAAAPEPLYKRLWARAKRSLTMALAAAMLGLGLLLDTLDVAALFLNMTEVQAVVTAYAGPYASHVFKGIGVLVALARMRSMAQ